MKTSAHKTIKAQNEDEAWRDQPTRNNAFWKKHGGVALVWSNPHASDSVMIQNALLKPSFHSLLEIAAHFGLERLKNEWEILKNNPNPYPEEAVTLRRIEPTVTRCLTHMTEGIQ